MQYFTAQNGPDTVIRQVLDDGTVLWIPMDPANTDYQRYLAWVAAGNSPEPWEG